MLALRQKCPYSELFWSAFFPYSVQIWENARKIWTKVTPNMDTFFAVFADKCKILYVLLCDYYKKLLPDK